MRAYCTLARSLNVGRETKEGGMVCLREGTDDRFVVLGVMLCVCTCVSSVCVLCIQLCASFLHSIKPPTHA